MSDVESHWLNVEAHVLRTAMPGAQSRETFSVGRVFVGFGVDIEAVG